MTLLTLLMSFNLTTVRAQLVSFDYFDASGNKKSAEGYYFMSPDDFPADIQVNGLPEGWYCFDGNVGEFNYADGTIPFLIANIVIANGTHLIAGLIDGSTLTFYAPASGEGTVTSDLDAHTLNIYAGTFNATNVHASNLNLYGGTLNATELKETNLTLCGGTIKSSSYNGTVTIADGLVYTYQDGDNVIYLSGTITDLDAIAGKTLSFYGYTYLDKDGKTAFIAKEYVTVINSAEDFDKAKGADGKLPGRWYLIQDDEVGAITNNADVTFAGDAHIILNRYPLSMHDIDLGGHTLFIHDRVQDVGGLILTTNKIDNGNLTLAGGTIVFNSLGDDFGTLTIADGLLYGYFDEQFNPHYLCGVIDDCKSLEGKFLFLVIGQSPVNIADCDITMPTQSMRSTDTNIGDKFAAAIDDDTDDVDEMVKYGDTKLTLGTDYRFGQVVFADDNTPCTDRDNKLFDEFLVEVKGIGRYYGSKWVRFTLVATDVDDIYADCIHWYFHNGILSIYRKSGLDGDVGIPVANENAPVGSDYPWYQVASSISKVQFAHGITSIPKHAFDCGEASHAYARLEEIFLPTTISDIDEYAFAYCDALYIDLNKISDNISIDEKAFYNIGCVAGDLMDNLSDGESNTTNLGFMLNAATADVTLKGRTLYKDGDWNTLCLPFDVGDDTAEDGHAFDDTPLKGAIVKTLVTGTGESSAFNSTTGALNLIFEDTKTVPAGIPCIVRWEKEPGYVNDGTCDINDPIFKGVKVTSDEPTKVTFDGGSFVGQYNNFAITDANIDEIILLGAGNTIGYAGEPRNLRPFRAHFSVPAPNDGGQAVKSYSISFGEEGEATGIIDMPADPSTKDAGSGYYSIDGRRLPAKPVSKGVYIHNGHKFIVK